MTGGRGICSSSRNLAQPFRPVKDNEVKCRPRFHQVKASRKSLSSQLYFTSNATVGVDGILLSFPLCAVQVLHAPYRLYLFKPTIVRILYLRARGNQIEERFRLLEDLGDIRYPPPPVKLGVEGGLALTRKSLFMSARSAGCVAATVAGASDAGSPMTVTRPRTTFASSDRPDLKLRVNIQSISRVIINRNTYISGWLALQLLSHAEAPEVQVTTGSRLLLNSTGTVAPWIPSKLSSSLCNEKKAHVSTFLQTTSDS
ncbi:hypothetical protein J6590_021438 [Homalodisca vitripennis]|nr:hypothetical protein J6590_021438 [Homalodisca vitripennis]